MLVQNNQNSSTDPLIAAIEDAGAKVKKDMDVLGSYQQNINDRLAELKGKPVGVQLILIFEILYAGNADQNDPKQASVGGNFETQTELAADRLKLNATIGKAFNTYQEEPMSGKSSNPSTPAQYKNDLGNLSDLLSGKTDPTFATPGLFGDDSTASSITTNLTAMHDSVDQYFDSSGAGGKMKDFTEFSNDLADKGNKGGSTDFFKLITDKGNTITESSNTFGATNSNTVKQITALTNVIQNTDSKIGQNCICEVESNAIRHSTTQ